MPITKLYRKTLAINDDHETVVYNNISCVYRNEFTWLIKWMTPSLHNDNIVSGVMLTVNEVHYIIIIIIIITILIIDVIIIIIHVHHHDFMK